MYRTLLLLFTFSASVAAQPVSFGSADNLFELGAATPSRDQKNIAGFAGFAYLPDAWRLGIRLEADIQQDRVSVGLGQTVHPSYNGLYGPESNEWLDLTNVLRYARLNPTASSRVYARLGPTEHLTLGSGALVRQYRTTAAWDERRIGFETAVEAESFSAAGFTDNLLFSGLAGAEAELTTGLGIGPIQKLRLSAAIVNDFGLRGDSAATGIEARLRGRLFGDGAVDILPFVSHSRLLRRGSATGFGVDATAPNINNAVRASGRVAVFVATPDFATGHFGPLYAIQNQHEGIAVASSFYDDSADLERAGTPIDSMRAGVDLVLESRFVAFGAYEASSYLRRHFGPDRASAFGIRLAALLTNDTRVQFALEREGFRGVINLLGGLGEENQLVLDLSTRIGTDFWMLVQSRYGFRRLSEAEIGQPDQRWFLVERRFEPMIGVRARL